MKFEPILQARYLRRSLRRLGQGFRFGFRSLSNSPILFANSFPKSGTHLLTQVLAGFVRLGPAVNSGLPAVVTFKGETGSQRPAAEILAEIERLKPGDVAYGHIHASPEAIAYLCQEGFAAYFILRDPRDVVISHVHYLTDMASAHIHHRFFQEILPDFDSRLLASIRGVSEGELREVGSHTGEITHLPLPDIRLRFEPFLGWLDHSQVLVLHYEDFLVNQVETIGNVVDHAVRRGFQTRYTRSQAVEILAGAIQPARSPTFRTGKSGSWKRDFSPVHKDAFKQVAGDLLIRLGYEADVRW